MVLTHSHGKNVDFRGGTHFAIYVPHPYGVCLGANGSIASETRHRVTDLPICKGEWSHLLQQ